MKGNNSVIWLWCTLLFFAGAIWGGAWPRSEFFLIENIHDLAEFGAAIATMVAVVIGLSAWKKQLRGQSDHDLARRLLLEAEKFKAQTLVISRSAENCLTSSSLHSADFSRLQEIMAGLREDLSNSDNCRARMEALLLEADVMWGQELRSRCAYLLELHDMCCYCVRDFLDFLDDPDDPSADKDLSWIEDKLSDSGWNLTEPERRTKMSQLTANASGYLKQKLVN